jgi:hypothetical protein
LRLDALNALAAVNMAVESEVRQQSTKGANEDPELLELRAEVKKLLIE